MPSRKTVASKETTPPLPRLGVHTSVAGGVLLSLERARALGCTTLQIFSHNPRTWKVAYPLPADAAQFMAERRRLDLAPLFIHTSYLVNLASPSADLLAKSAELLRAELDIADGLGADYLVLHTGSASGDHPERARQTAIRTLMDIGSGGRWKVRILLENTAGERGDITSRVEDLAEMISALGDTLIGGICLDTCHAFAAGYELTANKGLEALIQDIARHLGIKAVKLIHLNDAKKGLNSRVDRHEHLGRGAIGMKGLKKILSHPAIRGIPVIIETPKKDEEDDPRNLAIARSLMQQ